MNKDKDTRKKKKSYHVGENNNPFFGPGAKSMLDPDSDSDTELKKITAEMNDPDMQEQARMESREREQNKYMLDKYKQHTALEGLSPISRGAEHFKMINDDLVKKEALQKIGDFPDIGKGGRTRTKRRRKKKTKKAKKKKARKTKKVRKTRKVRKTKK
jgi:hypothetical protein